MPKELKMDLSEWTEKVEECKRLEAALGEARREIDTLRLGTDGSDARHLARALEHLIPVVQFAIATLDPIAYRGWPHAELTAFAELLPDLPGVSPFVKEIAVDLKTFARIAAEWEDARAKGIEREKFLAETANRAVDPATYRPEGATILDAAGKAFGEPGES